MDTETHADWDCTECDVSHQLFLEHRDGRWEVTEESQALLTHHRSGACRD